MFSPFDSSKTFDEKKFKNNTNFMFTSSSSQTMEFFNNIKSYVLDYNNHIYHRLCMLKTLESIPINNNIEILINIILKMSEESNINKSLLYFFWSNKKLNFYFNDEIKHKMYELYFNKVENIDIMFDMSCYLLSKFGNESIVRQDALDFLVDVTDDFINNSNEHVYTAANILFTYGQPDEKFYGCKIIQKVKELDKEVKIKMFELDSKIELEYYIFCKMYNSLNSLPISQKTIVLNSMKGEDKQDIDYFCFLHDCLDEVVKEYSNKFTKENIEEIYLSTVSLFSQL